MKTCKGIGAIVIAGGVLMSMISCEQKVRVESIVHEDGSIDRAVVLSEADSARLSENMFGANQSSGWMAQAEVNANDTSKDKKYKVTFHRHFASAEEANAVMNPSVDTVFKIRSEFDKKFRWFYTYLTYSDTYLAINHFQSPPIDNYITPEDYAFIDRLPAEDAPISKADSVYLSALNSKIFDQFASRAFYEGNFEIMIAVLKKNNVEKKWIDLLEQKKDAIFKRLIDNKDDFKNDFMLAIADSLHIPVPASASADFHSLSKDFERRVSFMSDASEGQFTHVITMPWDVIQSNADSTHGHELYWKPPVIKFLLKDYSMKAESRHMNIWAVMLSALVVLASAWAIFIRKR